jgi:hypothetical protein
MNWEDIRGHSLTLLSILSGIVGMGIVFNGAMHGSFVEISQGVPFLLMGLWWSGRELGRSIDASRRRRVRPQQEGTR